MVHKTTMSCRATQKPKAGVWHGPYVIDDFNPCPKVATRVFRKCRVKSRLKAIPGVGETSFGRGVQKTKPGLDS